VIFGELTREANRHLRDLSPREWALVAPLVLFIVWVGVYPAAFTGPTEATIEALITQVQSKASVAARAPAAGPFAGIGRP
jgi:NADH-quinone oxidoreductase subunit M